MTVAVVIVNWNGWRDTLLAHRSLAASDFADWHLFVVDNASSDGSLGELAVLTDRATVIAHPDNAGFAGGCNVGIRAAMAAGAEHIFLLNNDAAVRPDTLARLVSACGEAGESVLGCVVRYRPSGALQFFGSRTAPDTPAPAWFREGEDAAELERPLIASDFIFGAALFAPTALFARFGLFDERFFLTFEETDWCYRVRRAGLPCLVVRDAVVDHTGSASLGAADSPLQAYFLQRNRLLFYEKHGGWRQVGRGLRSAIGRIRRRIDEPRARRARTLAVRDYLLRRFGNCPPDVRRLMRREPD